MGVRLANASWTPKLAFSLRWVPWTRIQSPGPARCGTATVIQITYSTRRSASSRNRFTRRMDNPPHTNVDGHDQTFNTQVRAIEISFRRDPQREKETPCQRLIGSARIAR